MSPEEKDKDRKERIALAQFNRDEDLKKILSTPAGRRFYYLLIDGVTGSFGSSFQAENTHVTAFREGQRSIGLQLIKDAQRVTAQDYLRMLAEAAEAQMKEAMLREAEAKK